MSLSRPSKLRAAVVGLGKAGSRFDEEPRGAVWSHVGAYLAANDIYELAGAADPDADSRAAFSRRCPGVPCYTSAAEMCSAIRPDVVSIATPINVREQVFDDLLQGAAAPRAIICEKPLATNGHTRWQCVERCRTKGVPLLVHYNRRYASVYQRICTSIREGLIGDVTSITVRMANRLRSVGSHALDLLLYLAAEQPCTWRGLELPHLAQGGVSEKLAIQDPNLECLMMRIISVSMNPVDPVIPSSRTAVNRASAPARGSGLGRRWSIR